MIFVQKFIDQPFRLFWLAFAFYYLFRGYKTLISGVYKPHWKSRLLRTKLFKIDSNIKGINAKIIGIMMILFSLTVIVYVVLI